MSNLIVESAIFDKYKGEDEYDGKIEDAVKILKEIIKKRNFINIFRLDDEEDIEMTILTAFLNCKYIKYSVGFYFIFIIFLFK